MKEPQSRMEDQSSLPNATSLIKGTPVMSETQDLYKQKYRCEPTSTFPVPGIKGVIAPYPGMRHIVSNPRRRNWSSWALSINLELPFGVVALVSLDQEAACGFGSGRHTQQQQQLSLHISDNENLLPTKGRLDSSILCDIILSPRNFYYPDVIW